ncbi:MAG TPA: hypothetical protein H9881_03145 [Candidatus Stackebrandtia excrementipullorum]|nr:hypothetical protein [Candidatus Stackebrandtia excrementipullorum]
MNDTDENRRVGQGLSRFGNTWWSKRWLRTLDQLGLRYPDSRLPKARSMVRSGDVDLMHVEAGAVSAWVDQQAKSFEVTVAVHRFDDRQWERFVDIMAAQWRNLVAFSGRELPTDIDRQLDEQASLFPSDGELSTTCMCPDTSPVCVHVIALQHAFTVWLDEDPLLLFVLRGGEPETLMDRIRTAIAAQHVPTATLSTRPISAVSDFYAGTPDLTRLERIASLTAQK